MSRREFDDYLQFTLERLLRPWTAAAGDSVKLHVSSGWVYAWVARSTWHWFYQYKVTRSVLYTTCSVGCSNRNQKIPDALLWMTWIVFDDHIHLKY